MTTLSASKLPKASVRLFLRLNPCNQAPNPSIERTCPGKPGHASHVKRRWRGAPCNLTLPSRGRHKGYALAPPLISNVRRQMSTRPKLVLLLLAAGSSFATLASQIEGWQREPPSSAFPRLWSHPRLPETSIHQVESASVSTAAKRLATSSFVALSCAEANKLIGSSPVSCSSRAKPYLVRAVTGHPKTGSFAVYYDRTTLYVNHGSLGEPISETSTPLVLMLPFRPSAVFVWATYAK